MKYKRLTAGLLACAMVLGMGGMFPKRADFSQAELVASAANEKTYGDWRYVKYGKYVEITHYYGNAETIEIPAEIEGMPVTHIGDSAFGYNSKLTTVIMPECMTTIGGSAFYCCYELTSIIFPNNMESIGSFAFANCFKLTSIEFPNSVTTIGQGAFRDCHELSSITIPNSVTEIGNWAFGGCSELTSVVIPDSVKSIEEGTFNSCTRLMSITIPKSVTKIGWFAFEECSSLEDVYYTGTEAQWTAIQFEGGKNDILSANIHYEISISSLVDLNKTLKTKKGAPKKYDLNGDNVVNVIDLALLKQKLLSK